MKSLILLLMVAALLEAAAQAQRPPKRIPPAGIPVPEAIRSALAAKLRVMQSEADAAYHARHGDNSLQFFADVQIYEKAVRYALEHNEFFRTNEFAIAEKLIAEGVRRAREFKSGNTSWLRETGLLVNGYQSRIDGSVQPYGLVVPNGYRPNDGKRYRLDVWLHGRDETLTELKFMNERMTKVGEFAPEDTFVLHPYGRYCNAFKFAGEVDVFEALEAVRGRYPIDASRIVLRGFSMGGAGVWHLATHHADHWVVAAPGAGFAETAKYLRVKPEGVPEYERALWQWYDATDYALNLFQCPTVAYSGELDKQRQAADVMDLALRSENLPLMHLIGPGTEHKYHPETKRLLEAVVDALAAKGKVAEPPEIRFTTRTLQYPRMHWMTLLGLEKHWSRADVRGKLSSNRIILSLTNVTAFMLDLDRRTEKELREVEVNGQRITNLTKAPYTAYLVFFKTNEMWTAGGSQERIFTTMTKGIGHQGPIDDAFTDSFVFVPPLGEGFHAATTGWVEKEFKRAVFEWRAQFRGDAKIVRDNETTNHPHSNLVLWGDPKSNELIRRILPQLPLKWTENEIEFAGKKYDARRHLPLMIFPNPLKPDKYVVLNSGFTFRGFGSNADQTPKLPDYAIIDVETVDPFRDGVAAAGFFDEQWRVK